MVRGLKYRTFVSFSLIVPFEVANPMQTPIRLLFGTGRDPQSRRTLEERRTDYTASYITLDPRDVRLGLSRRLFDLTDIGSSLPWGPSRPEQEHASKEVNDLLASYNWLYRLIIPLPGPYFPLNGKLIF